MSSLDLIPASVTVGLRAERAVGIPTGPVRAELLRALRDQHFRIRVERLTLIEATRGGQLAVVAGAKPGRVPLMARVQLDPVEEGTRVVVELVDRWRGPMSSGLGLREAYREAMSEALERVDRALERLGADRAGFPEPQRLGADMAADGRPGLPGAAAAEAGLARIDSPRGQARLTPADLQAMLTTGVLIASRPGSLPPALAGQVERFVARVEPIVSAAGDLPPRIEVSAEEAPVVEFLRQQARIRAEVPLRTLEVCTTCRFEKVANPDYKRLAKRNRTIRNLGGSVGALIGVNGISPYVLVGRFVQFKNLDPDFVCPRCQGIEADPSLITFCPDCGDRRAEAVLRKCERCDHDFRAHLAPEELWREPLAEPVAPVPPPPVGPPPASWYPDPAGRHELRYWDGAAWSAHVSNHGTVALDSLAEPLGQVMSGDRSGWVELRMFQAG